MRVLMQQILFILTFISNVFINFDILEQFLGLVPIRCTAIDKYSTKAKVQFTKIKFLKLQLFASIFRIKIN